MAQKCHLTDQNAQVYIILKETYQETTAEYHGGFSLCLWEEQNGEAGDCIRQDKSIKAI